MCYNDNTFDDVADFSEDSPEEVESDLLESARVPEYERTYDVVSLMMYLSGIEQRRFEEHRPPLTEKYEELDRNDDARIIRHLCILRTSFIRNFHSILNGIYALKTFSMMPEYFSSESMEELEKNGIVLQNGKRDINYYTIQLNVEIEQRIGKVRQLFPDWLNWEYVKSLFCMPKGHTLEGVKKAADFYNQDRSRYPFQVWLNWRISDCGNIFLHDYRFCTLLYQANHDEFQNTSLVNGTRRDTEVNFHDFLHEHQDILIIVDCENSDPVKLAAALDSLPADLLQNIYKIVFVDSKNTSQVWDTLCRRITRSVCVLGVEVEHNMTATLYANKSQVDMALALTVQKEVSDNSLDAVILASSDSDYWTMIQFMPETDFLVFLEKLKSGKIIRDKLEENGYHYCYIDDFCTGKVNVIKTDTILDVLQDQIDEMVHFNIKKMFEDQIRTNWFSFTEKERDDLYTRYLQKMKLKIDKEGEVRIRIREGK